jgi:myo-inositol 2-dehydrogenase / D-chiro-inositol 1-dehydrogenase
MPLRIGIAGCGAVAREVHLPILKSFQGVEICALAEQNESWLQEGLQLTPSAKGYSDYLAMLEEAALDAVLVCLPTHLHGPAAEAVLGQGLHLYLEKPLSGDLASGRKALEAWLKMEPRPVAMMGFNFRRERLMEDIAEKVRSNQVGRIRHLHSVNSQAAALLPEWKKARSTGGGVVLDLASHHLDLWEYLLGSRITEISARLQSLHTCNDNATVEAITENGTTCFGFFSFNCVNEDRFTIYGDQGRLSVERFSSLAVEQTSSSGKFARLKKLLSGLKNLAALPHLLDKYKAPWSSPSYARSLAVFIESVQQRRSVQPDLTDGYRALELVIAAERAAASGKPVQVSQPIQ